MAQSRANKGGEYGANGEWYEGGKFIARTDRPKGKARKSSTRKIEIEPYVWVEDTGRKPIMKAFSECFLWENGSPVSVHIPGCNYRGIDSIKAEEARIAYISGARYIDEI